MHDEISTDKNDPTVNGYGPVYAVSAGHGKLTVLDPIENDTLRDRRFRRARTRAKVQSRFPPPAMPSNFWGMQHLWGLENPGRSAQPDDGSQGPRLDDVEDPQRGAGLVPRRLEPQVRAATTR